MSHKAHRLLILNFVTDEDHPIFGFGVSWVQALAERLGHVHVVTGSRGRAALPSNVSVDSINWAAGRDFDNVRRLQRATRHALRSFKPDAVFTHMAAPYAAVMGPEIRLRGLRHVLWYAHASRSKGLVLAYPWVNAIATPTPESCPLSGTKVHILGHGIDTSLFAPSERSFESVEHGVHWGRADRSKRIDRMLEAVRQVHQVLGLPASFTQIGSPATPEEEAYWARSQGKYLQTGLFHWIPGTPRSQLLALARDQDVFLHAFPGSLDKAPLEAAATGLPVLSENPSVRRELGAWPSAPDLVSQLMSFVQEDSRTREAFARQQQRQVLANHSLNSLAARLLSLIYPSSDFPRS